MKNKINTKNIVAKLGTAIKQQNKEELVSGLMNFVISFFPDSSGSQTTSYRKVLENQLGLQFDTNSPRRKLHYISDGINDLLEAFEQKKDKAHLFGFFSGASGQRIYFDTINNQMRYAGSRLNNSALERYVELYGKERINLNQ